MAKRPPKRSVVAAGGVFKFGAWDEAKEIFDGHAFRGRVAAAARIYAREVAEEIRVDLVKTLAGGKAEGPRLHEFTRNEKGHDTKLYDTGELANSVRVVQMGAFTFGIGFRSGEGSHGGKVDIATIAVMNEYGYKIKVTPRMRRALAMRGFPLKPSTETLVIPPRPFVRPAFERASKRLASGLERIRRREFGKRLVGGR